MAAGATPTLEPFQRSVDVHCGIGQHAGLPHSSRETTAGRVRLDVEENRWRWRDRVFHVKRHRRTYRRSTISAW